MSSDMAPRNRDGVAVRRSPMKTLSRPTHPHACRAWVRRHRDAAATGDDAGFMVVGQASHACPSPCSSVLCLPCPNSCPNQMRPHFYPMKRGAEHFPVTFSFDLTRSIRQRNCSAPHRLATEDLSRSQRILMGWLGGIPMPPYRRAGAESGAVSTASLSSYPPTRLVLPSRRRNSVPAEQPGRELTPFWKQRSPAAPFPCRLRCPNVAAGCDGRAG